MTARLGGLWDSLLGEGRRWWITANSDSHVHWREGGSDFWPGEYSKTWVRAERTHDSILEGLRAGRIFVTLGDLVSDLRFEAIGSGRSARTGGTLEIDIGDDVEVRLRIRDPEAPNHNGGTPSLARIDLIVGEVHGLVSDPSVDVNPTTRVAARFDASDWTRDGEWIEVHFTLPEVNHDLYLRVRGTNGEELEPLSDPPGEDPWSDLWFYSNPVFVELER